MYRLAQPTQIRIPVVRSSPTLNKLRNNEGLLVFDNRLIVNNRLKSLSRSLFESGSDLVPEVPQNRNFPSFGIKFKFLNVSVSG